MPNSQVDTKQRKNSVKSEVENPRDGISRTRTQDEPKQIAEEVLAFILSDAVNIKERSQEYANTQNEKRLNDLDQQAAVAREQERPDIEQRERKNLTPRQRKVLDNEKDKNYSKVKAGFDKKVNAEFQKIDERFTSDRKRATEEQMPKDYADKKQEYDDFLRNTRHHPLSFRSLDFTGGNVNKAQEVINYIQKFPELNELVEGKGSSLKLWESTVNTLGSEATADILRRIGLKNLIPFSNTDQGTALLKDIHGNPKIGDEKFKEISGSFNAFKPYTENDEARTELASLLASQTLANLKGLLDILKNKSFIEVSKQPAFINEALSSGRNIEALNADLEHALKIDMKPRRFIELVKSLTPNSKEDILNKVGKESEGDFKDWVKVVDFLIARNHFTIKEVGGSKELPSLNGKPPTFERSFKIIDDKGDTKKDWHFKVHYHPEASDAKIGQTNASKRHLKPRAGGNIRVKWEQVRNLDHLGRFLPKIHKN